MAYPNAAVENIVFAASPVRRTSEVTSSFMSPPALRETERGSALSPGLLDRIFERKRAALVDLNGSAEAPPRRRLRLGDPEERPEEKVAVQRFTLVSRGAPPAKRTPAELSVLITPPRVAAQLGDSVQLCRCSQCDRQGIRRRMSGRRLCRRDTEAHPEYALLLNMNDRFEAENPERRSEGAGLVSEACCREKSAYFIIGPGATTIGYVAAEVASNRRVKRGQESVTSDVRSTDQSNTPDEKVPTLLQVFVEPEFRNRGYASEALALLLREHHTVKVDDPTPAVLRALQRMHFRIASTQEGIASRPLVTLIRGCNQM